MPQLQQNMAAMAASEELIKSRENGILELRPFAIPLYFRFSFLFAFAFLFVLCFFICVLHFFSLLFAFCFFVRVVLFYLRFLFFICVFPFLFAFSFLYLRFHFCLCLSLLSHRILGMKDPYKIEESPEKPNVSYVVKYMQRDKSLCHQFEWLVEEINKNGLSTERTI